MRGDVRHTQGGGERRKNEVNCGGGGEARPQRRALRRVTAHSPYAQSRHRRCLPSAGNILLRLRSQLSWRTPQLIAKPTIRHKLIVRIRVSSWLINHSPQVCAQCRGSELQSEPTYACFAKALASRRAQVCRESLSSSAGLQCSIAVYAPSDIYGGWCRSCSMCWRPPKLAPSEGYTLLGRGGESNAPTGCRAKGIWR